MGKDPGGAGCSWGGCQGWQRVHSALQGTLSGALSRFLLLPALHHKESVYFPGVAGLPPLTWTLFGAAQTVWQGWGRLGWLQSQHTSSIPASGVGVGLAAGIIPECHWWGGTPSSRGVSHPRDFSRHVSSWTLDTCGCLGWAIGIRRL